MWLTVLPSLCILRMVSGVQVDVGGLLTARDWPYPTKESLVYQYRRLGRNESTSLVNSHSDIHLRQLIIEIGVIVGFILLALGILCIIMSWVLSWKNARDGIPQSQGKPDPGKSILRTESILVPPMDAEEIQSVLEEYERITAQLQNWSATDFTKCKTIKAVFKDTRPVVTPFVRKSFKLPGNNKRSTEPIVKTTIFDDVFDEKRTASGSMVNLSILSGIEEVDSRSKSDKRLNSLDIGKALWFNKKEGKFQISRNKQEMENMSSELTITSPSARRPPIQLGSNSIPRQLSSRSGGFQVIF